MNAIPTRTGNASLRLRIGCPMCGTAMNRHAEKIDPSLSSAEGETGTAAGFDGVLQEFHTCPNCRYVLERRVG